MIALQEQVASAIRERQLFRPRQRILVAASGGVDSMVMLHLLHELSREAGWKLTVAHLNHRLRGNSSMADERLVCRTAKALKLPSVVAQVDVRGFAEERGLSLEMAARRLRHDFLARAAAERGIPTVAVAHHLDDQVELFFLRLFRGGGSLGLAGMKWNSPSPSDVRIKLVRPLLGCTRRAVLDYAAESKVPFREDATNASLDIQRNRIRHELLPLLRREYQPGVDEKVVRVMEILAAEAEFVTAAAEAWLQTGFGAKPVPLYTSGEKIGILPVAVQRRCLQLQLEWMRVSPDFGLVEHLRQHSGRPIEVSRERVGQPCHVGQCSKTEILRLVAENGRIVSVPAKMLQQFQAGSAKLDLSSPGQRDWHNVQITWEVRRTKGHKIQARNPGSEYFDADAVGSKAVIRHWQPGDRFQPIGMEHATKLQDLFVNQKIPEAQRRQLLVAVTTRGELFWVEGLRISERFKLTVRTIRRLQWRWQRH